MHPYAQWTPRRLPRLIAALSPSNSLQYYRALTLVVRSIHSNDTRRFAHSSLKQRTWLECFKCKQTMPSDDLGFHKCAQRCEDCGKSVVHANRRSHKCYRKRKGLKLYECDNCGAEFIFPSALALHQKVHEGGNPYTSPYLISSADLQSGTFSRHEHVLAQRLIHATKLSNTDSILSDGFLRGGSGSSYDAVLFTEPDAPPSSFTEVRPASDAHVFPYSFYPKDVPILGDISILTIDTNVLLHDDYRMFYHKTSPKQHGPRFTHVALSQIIFVHQSDLKSLAFAQQHFLPLDKRRNSVFRHGDRDGWTFATRVSHRGVDGQVAQRPHKVVVVFLGGLRIDASTNVEILHGRRTGTDRSMFPCPIPGCIVRSPKVPLLKEHLVRYHSSDPSIPCKFAGCDYKAWLHKDLRAHERRCHIESSGESLDVSNAIDVNTHRSLPLQRRLRIVQYVGPVIAHAIAEERDKRGPYKDWDDVQRRVALSRSGSDRHLNRAIASLRKVQSLFFFSQSDLDPVTI